MDLKCKREANINKSLSWSVNTWPTSTRPGLKVLKRVTVLTGATNVSRMVPGHFLQYFAILSSSEHSYRSHDWQVLPMAEWQEIFSHRSANNRACAIHLLWWPLARGGQWSRSSHDWEKLRLLNCFSAVINLVRHLWLIYAFYDRGQG